MFSEYQAVLLDIDGTITRTDRTISQATQDAIVSVGQQRRIGTCTGRSLPEVISFIEQWWPQPSWHILGGGGQVVRLENNRWDIVWEQTLSNELAHTIVDTVTQLGAEVGFAHQHTYVATGKILERKRQQLPAGSVAATADLTDWTAPLIAVVNLNPDVESFIDTLHHQGKVVAKCMLNYHQEPYYDLTAPGVTKSLGAQHWSELMGIPLAQTIAVGDSENDREVLQTVGMGVAMGNALPSLQAVAKHVIGHTDNDGLAEFLRSL